MPNQAEKVEGCFSSPLRSLGFGYCKGFCHVNSGRQSAQPITKIDIPTRIPFSSHFALSLYRSIRRSAKKFWLGALEQASSILEVAIPKNCPLLHSVEI